jgi:hypothetical protein
LPAEQTWSVQVRDCVPDVSQVLSNPPHAPQEPHVRAPHDIPSVSRVQLCISMTVCGAHTPASQTLALHERVWTPVVAHASGNMHVPHAPH